MEPIFVFFEDEPEIMVHAYPFSEEEVFRLFDLVSTVKINSAYIRIFGPDDVVGSDGITWLTEVNLFDFKNLKELADLCRLPLNRDVNELNITLPDHNCSVCVNDENDTSFYIKKNGREMLTQICRVICPSDYTYLSTLAIENKNKYVCFYPQDQSYTIYASHADMIVNAYYPIRDE